MDLSELTHEAFHQRLGDTFRLDLGGEGVVELELTEAEKQAGEGTDGAFSILFKGPKDRLLDQRIYALEHAGLGSLSVFLVPVAETDDGYVYEAVFTRLDRVES